VQLRDGFARSLVNCPASFPGAPVTPFHGAGDERIVVVLFYRRVTNLSEGQEVAPKSGAVKEANPALALFVPRIHPAFVVPGRGVVWKMKEDLSAPYPGFGFGALDAFDGYVSYRCLDEHALAREIAEMRALIHATAENLTITQDLGLGMMLWLTHFFPAEDWAVAQRRRSLAVLDLMWRKDGYFCREPNLPHVKFAFTNYGVSIGLQSVEVMTERVSFSIITGQATSMTARPSPT
jgi:hypothetical protein